MRPILPGRPHAGRQAISTAYWNGIRLTAYVSRNAIVITTGLYSLLQTIYLDCEELQAVAIEEFSGRIAACNNTTVYVFEPLGQGKLKWEPLGTRKGVLTTSVVSTNGDINGDIPQVNGLQSDPVLRRASIPTIDAVNSISWASAEELLVGGSRLQLWHVAYDSRVLWDQELPYPIAMACCSHDAALIASCGQHDRLVKIWRRLSYESDSTRFDVSYLPHNSSVTNLHWRKPWHKEQNMDSLLYTFCSDGYVRAWAYMDPHSVSVMQKVASIDTQATIQPRRLSVGSISPRRYAFIIDSRDFSHATERAVENATNAKADHALEHLIEIANRSPEICIVLDGLGHMSAWGLENAGCKNRNPAEVFNVAHVDNVDISSLEQAHLDNEHVQFCTYAGGDSPSSISLLVHSFDGTISHYEAHIAGLFDTARRRERLQQSAAWAGHDQPVQGILQNKAGDQLCTWTSYDVNIFSVDDVEDGNTLTVQASRSFDSPIIDALFVEDHLIVLLPDSLQLLPSRDSIPLTNTSAPTALQLLDAHLSTSNAHFAITYPTHTQIWLPQPPSPTSPPFAPAPVDPPGHTYLHALYTSHTAPLTYPAILAAHNSTTQSTLLSLTTTYHGNKLPWSAASTSRIPLWLTTSPLTELFTQIAQSEYTSPDNPPPRSPIPASLFYLALNNKPLLQSLWRTAHGVAERENTLKLLGNNFNDDPKWRKTALKNAYALLSKRRFRYAAAWFLLGGSVRDAVRVCCGEGQVGDLVLGVAVARVCMESGVGGEGEGERVLREVIGDVLLPRAEKMVEEKGGDVEGGEALRELGEGLLRSLGEEPAESEGDDKSSDEEEQEKSRDDAVGKEVKEDEDEVEKRKKPQVPPPTQFAEPSGDSLLDSFGF